MSEPEVSPSGYWVPVVDYTFRILEVFSDGERELALKELSSQSGVGRTSTFRILFTLAKNEYIIKNPVTGKYRLGPRMKEIAWRSLRAHNLAEVARPVLEELRDRFDETVNLAVVQGKEIVYIQILESRRAFRMSATVGARAALHATAIGKAIAAFLPMDVLNEMLAGYAWTGFTPRTITEQTKFVRILRKVRKLGYSMDDEESERGASCLGAPILDGSLRAIAAISVSGPVYRIRSKQGAIIRKLKEAANLISRSQSG
jgi:DNA-binding IclR family transcriptional regulator